MAFAPSVRRVSHLICQLILFHSSAFIVDDAFGHPASQASNCFEPPRSTTAVGALSGLAAFYVVCTFLHNLKPVLSDRLEPFLVACDIHLSAAFGVSGYICRHGKATHLFVRRPIHSQHVPNSQEMHALHKTMHVCTPEGRPTTVCDLETLNAAIFMLSAAFKIFSLMLDENQQDMRRGHGSYDSTGRARDSKTGRMQNFEVARRAGSILSGPTNRNVTATLMCACLICCR